LFDFFASKPQIEIKAQAKRADCSVWIRKTGTCYDLLSVEMPRPVEILADALV